MLSGPITVVDGAQNVSVHFGTPLCGAELRGTPLSGVYPKMFSTTLVYFVVPTPSYCCGMHHGLKSSCRKMS